MLLSLLGSGDITSAIVSLLLTLPIFMFALSIHEAAHGYIAYKCGDNTAKAFGRLTLNPLKHLDPIGFVCMLLFGYGWAKPVPINSRNFRNYKRGMAFSAAAGPLSNLLVGLLSAVLYGVFYSLYLYVAMRSGEGFLTNVMYWTTLFAIFGAQINLIFAFFNLIPVPPFDGSRLAWIFLPQKLYFKITQYERQILLGVLLVMIVLNRVIGFSPFGWLADSLINLISVPVSKGMMSLLFP